MANRRSYKTDESFLEKLAIGAIGTRAVFKDLTRHGHTPIELERGSMSYKIWKYIKIKRIRVPDLLCLKCATRVEARAKTKLEISMSHSVSDPNRGWDRGLTDKDFVALVLCAKAGDEPVDWKSAPVIQYVSVADLRKAYKEKRVVVEKPKGAQEGFEIRLIWPSIVASGDGVITEASNKKFQFRRSSDNRIISYRASQKGISLQPLVKADSKIAQGQIIGSVVSISPSLTCARDVPSKKYIENLNSASVEERYTATKALGHLGEPSIVKELSKRMDDEKEHIYVRLEAAAGLMRLKQGAGIQFMEKTLGDTYLENQLETVILMGEIPSDQSQSTLQKVLLDSSKHPEIRAGAAWALGELGQPNSGRVLIQAFNEIEEPIKIEAARALRKLAGPSQGEIISRLPSATENEQAGISWALSRMGNVDTDKLLNVLENEDARRWVAYILGSQDQSAYIGQIEKLKNKDPEVYFAVTVLWKIMSSWIYKLKEY